MATSGILPSSSSTSSSTADTLQQKLVGWFSMYSCLFRRRRTREKDKFEDQQVELIKGGIKTGNGVHHGNTKDSDTPSDKDSSTAAQEYINYGEEDQMEIEGYKRTILKTIITWVFIILTGGLLRLIFHWWPRLMLYSTHNKCSIQQAEKILATEHYQDKYKRYHVKPIYTLSADLFSFSSSVSSGDVKERRCSSDVNSVITERTVISDGDTSTVGDGSSSKNFRDCSIHMDPSLSDLANVEGSATSKAHQHDHHHLLAHPFSWVSLLYDLIYASIVENSNASRTMKLFASAGLSADQMQETGGTWDQRLEQELQSIDSPKLAIPNSNGSIREAQQVRTFSCKKLRYIWDDQYESFVKLEGFDAACTQYLHQNQGLSVFQQCQRRLIYGNNEIKVEVNSIVKLLFLEVLNPFYVFQIFSVALWMSDNYVYFATAIIIMSVFGIISTIIQTRQNQKKLKRTVQSSDIVTVCRGAGVYESIPTEHLVPGDLIVIPPHGCTMNCDAALLSGNCIVNESMLTGESVPVTKIPLPNRPDVFYNSKEHARHTLFCGTQIMQTRYYGNERVMALILRTGFLTAKGSLVRSIMYPPPVDYKFERDSYKFVAVLAGIAGVGFAVSIMLKLANGDTWRNIIVDSLDLITIVVPPALPAAMTVGRMYAQRRLQKKGIYCISPRAINVSGSIDCVCFDKTGTLTEEGLDLWGAVPTGVSNGKGKTTWRNEEEETWKNDITSGEASLFFHAPVRQVDHLSPGPFLVGMAACHSLTRIDGNLIGDPLDLKMFEWTGWALEEPGVADNEKFDMIAPTVVRPKLREVNDNVPIPNKTAGMEDMNRASAVAASNDETTVNGNAGERDGTAFEVGIVRQFPFSSSLQRMSVITRTLGASEFELYSKGSPEMISSLSLPHTIPDNFAATLERYTQQGYRVIALGHRRLPKLNYAKVQRVVREEVETDMTFLGLIIMENRLKAETAGVMRVLKKCLHSNHHGDNMLTAVSVARECGMLESTDKVIVLSAEDDNKESKLPKLSYKLANKVSPMELESVAGSPVMSVGSGNNCSGSLDVNLLPMSSCNNVESPANRYHFAVTGNVFSIVKTHYPELLPSLLVRGTVFARMSPDQKQQLVQHLQALGYFVGMCGDGANDCGALKAAHAGISLSEAESSVASPFTSKEPNITCIPYLIREGRGALVTSFGIFKYMAVYSMTQFITVIILYTINANLSDLQFLYIDLFLISVFALFFGRTEPYAGPLEKRPPSASLVSIAPIVSLICHVGTILGVQILAFMYVQHQTWFKRYDPPKCQEEGECAEDFSSYENYSLFTISSFQYIIMALVFSRGKPYRKSVLTNLGLLVSIIAMTLVTIYLILWPADWFRVTLQIKLPPDFTFRLVLIGFAMCNFVIALLIEHGIVNFILGKKLEQLSSKGPKSSKEFMRIDYDLAQRMDWPPIGPQSFLTSVKSGSRVENESHQRSVSPIEHVNMTLKTMPEDKNIPIITNPPEIIQDCSNNSSYSNGHLASSASPRHPSVQQQHPDPGSNPS